MKRRVLGTSNWLIKDVIYDKYAHVIQISENNHLNFVKEDLSTLQYDFSGKLLKSKKYQKIASGKDITVVDSYEYDHVGRPTKISQNLNNSATTQIIAAYEYNALGQLVDKKLHYTGTAYIQSVDYRYNIRGWLTFINNSTLTSDAINNDETNDVFGMQLLYNVQDAGIGNTKYYNGNISAVKWKTNDVNYNLNPKRERGLRRKGYYLRPQRQHTKSCKVRAAKWSNSKNTH